MAATVRMRTWSSPAKGDLYPWVVVLVAVLCSVNEAGAAPETGLWKIIVDNVSIAWKLKTAGHLKLTLATLAVLGSLAWSWFVNLTECIALASYNNKTLSFMSPVKMHMLIDKRMF